MLILIIIIILLAIGSASTSIYFYQDKFGTGYFTKAGEWGAFGDFFGGVLNPTFTFLSIILLAYTLYQNRKALAQTSDSLGLGQKSLEQSAESLQQNQRALEINTEELSVSSKALESSSEALHAQTIGNVFFNLLNQHNNIVNNLSFNFYKVKNSITNGHPTRSTKTSDGRSVFSDVIKILSEVDNSKTVSRITDEYGTLNSTHNYILGHYFRNLFQIIKYIHEYSDLESELKVISKSHRAQKNNFMRILRAQLSSEEILLLLINGLQGVVDEGQFKYFLIEYSMLKHIVIDYHNVNNRKIRLNPNILITEDEFLEYITPEKSAFGDHPKAVGIYEKIKSRPSEE